ncbi:MAG: hypothetical protein AAF614_24950 [Chloroflexota bacterium]
MIDKTSQQNFVEKGGSAAIRSRKSKEKSIYAVCHHTGHYLTRAETNPDAHGFFFEQHDFPGLPKLDRLYAKAAHSKAAQHPVWSYAALFAAGLILFALFIAGFLLLVSQSATEPAVRTAWQGFFLLLISACLLGAWLLLRNRDAVFHWLAASEQPSVSGYPLDCNYNIEAVEAVQVDLGNAAVQRATVQNQLGRLKIRLTPKESELEDYQAYRQRYGSEEAGSSFSAGMLALDKLAYANFSGDALKFGHQLWLEDKLELLEAGKPVDLEHRYQIHEDAFYPWDDELERFPLSCRPKLSPVDSRQLLLEFQWWGDAEAKLVLESCQLAITDEMGSRMSVVGGNLEGTINDTKAVWRKKPFSKDKSGFKTCTVSLALPEKPILDCKNQITGQYHIVVKEYLISGMEVKVENLWAPRGLRAGKDGNKIEKRTAFVGKLTLDPQRLSQQNEYLEAEETRAYPVAPNEETVQAVMDVLVNEGWDMRHVGRSAPRLSPTGGINRRLHYWSMIGRSYQEESFDTIGIHVVLSGYDEITQGDETAVRSGQTIVDLRVGCLHDPRNEHTPARVQSLLVTPDPEDKEGQKKIRLLDKIEQKIKQRHGL